MTSETERPSALSAFMRGSMSGLFSGAVMMGILFAVSFIPGLAVLAPHLLIASGMVLATGLFGGAMGLKRAMFDTPHSTNNPNMIAMPLPTATSPTMAMDMTPSMDMADDAPSTSSNKSWVAQTGRGDDAQGRIQQILANGALSDKDRASAILAAREASTEASANRGA